jgi:hypothetical protein
MTDHRPLRREPDWNSEVNWAWIAGSFSALVMVAVMALYGISTTE